MRRATLLSMAFSLVAAGIGLVGAAPANAANTVVTVAGGNGAGDEANQLDIPLGLALDRSGNVYVADSENARAQRWAPSATSGVTVAGGNGNGSAANQLEVPEGVALDSSGNLYVADYSNDRVQRWAPGATSGVTVAGGNGNGDAANQLDRPSRVAMDNSDNLYVSDLGNHRVQRWAPGATSGVTVAGGHGPGDAADQLHLPAGLALASDGHIYIADRENSRVQRWLPGATSGVTVAGGNGNGSAANQLLLPGGVALDSSGNVYVGDTSNNRVQRWAPGSISGVTVAGGNGAGDAANQLLAPTDVVVDGSANLYVTDTQNHRVQRWALVPTVVPSQATVAEGTSGTSFLEVPVSLLAPTTEVVTVQWMTLQVPGDRPDQADPITDYTPTSGIVTFDPGESDTTVTIAITGDNLVEPNEYVIVSFNNPTNATMGGFWGLGIGFITNDDHAVATPGIASTVEGDTGTNTLAVPITLSHPSTHTITVQWMTVPVPGVRPDQADSTTDYTSTYGTVTFDPGHTSRTANVTINGDTLVEPDEYIIVSFHDPTNATMGGFWGLGIGFITNDD